MKDLLHPLPRETKTIVVTPYNPEWPKMFEMEAAKIQDALGSNFFALHHIGSTAVPGLAAKPVIDMIGVVKHPQMAIQPLENLGFPYKGEYNIPMRFYFNRCEKVETNLHVYEKDHPEIELNLIRLHMMKCTHYAEWDTAKRLRQKYFFDPLSNAK